MSDAPGQPQAAAGDEEQIPGYAEAIAQETEARDLAFVIDTPETLCGVPVLPLDLRSLILLTHAGNAFVCGGTADIEDVRMLLWLQWPAYSPDPEVQRCFIESLPAVDETAASADIRTWIDQTFSDAPPGKARKVKAGIVLEEPIASFVASWVDLFASEFGWKMDYIVGTPQRRGVPLRCLYQLQRCIVRRHNRNASFSSAKIARLIGDWLRGGQSKEETKKA